MAIRFFESVLLSAFLALVGFSLGHLVGVFVKSMIEENADIDKIRAVISRRALLERGLDNRTRARRTEMAKIDREIKEQIRQRISLDQQCSQALSIADYLVRIVGEELVGRQRYLALVFNKYVGGSGSGASLIDPSWAAAQEIEIWATSLAEARGELDKRFPPSFGYNVSSLIEAFVDTPIGDVDDGGAPLSGAH